MTSTCRVTIVRDRETRESKGVAFVLFVERTSAQKAVTALNRKELFGRTIKCSIARDNGRATEFIRRKTYKDKTRSKPFQNVFCNTPNSPPFHAFLNVCDTLYSFLRTPNICVYMWWG